MPNSFANKPGFYEDGDTSAPNNQNESAKKSTEPGKAAQDGKKKFNAANDNAKRSVPNIP